MKGIHKKIIFSYFLVFLATLGIFSSVNPARPFGGRVITSPIPGAVCPTSLEPTSPFAIAPTPLLLPGPFSEVPGPTGHGQVVTGAWILGLHLPVPIPDCLAPIPPLGSLPVFKAFLFGTSIPLNDPV